MHPDYAKNGWIYISYSDPGENDSAMTAVIRAKLKGNALVEIQQLFKAPAATYRTGNVHFGTRFVFDGKGHVFFSIGERGQQDRRAGRHASQRQGAPHQRGRLDSQGQPVCRQGRRDQEHLELRSPQPAGPRRMHPTTGALYDVEHGPRGGDELNLVEKGKNYGWPVITYGMNYNGTPMTDKTAAPGMEQPLTYWVPSIAVSSIGFYTGTQVPGVEGQPVPRIARRPGTAPPRADRRPASSRKCCSRTSAGLRDVVMGPDGAIYIAFNQPDRIARIVPAPATRHVGRGQPGQVAAAEGAAMAPSVPLALDRGDAAIFDITTAAPGPAGQLPLTPDDLLQKPSGDLFGWSLDVGMGWAPGAAAPAADAAAQHAGRHARTRRHAARPRLPHRTLGSRPADA